MGRPCRRRACPGYVDRWLRDQVLRVRANLDRWQGGTRMATFTAPGQPTKKHPNGLTHYTTPEGGLRVVQSEADFWHSDADKRLSALVKAARKRLQRERPGAKVRLLVSVPAFQKRGMLHWHAVYGYKSQRECNDCARLMEILASMVEQYGFGHQFDGGQVFENAKQAASYVARYATADHQGLERVVVSGFCPKRPVYVSRELTSVTGVTMRFLRWRRWSWWEIGVTSMDDCVKLYRLVIFMQGAIAAGHRRRLLEALQAVRALRAPPIVSARSTVQRVQLALPF
jgi:hypothetical protein